MRLQDHVEVEVKLTVIGDDPDALLDQVARLDGTDGVVFGPCQSHRLHDVYWDLPDHSMRDQHLSVRLRQIDDRLVFTAKGGTSSADGLFRRYELEVPATYENWVVIRQELMSEGARLERTGDANGTPADWLSAAGLSVTQDRSTRRTVRMVYAVDAPDHPVAELALDRTRFQFGTLTVDYWEIEIEQVDPGYDPAEVGFGLLVAFPKRLEFSTMGKYSRGLAIERELREAGRI